MYREGGDFSLQVPGVPLGKGSLEQLLNDGEKVVERTNRDEGMGVWGTQHTPCGCQQKGISYGGKRDVTVVELPSQSAVGWSRSRRCVGQFQVSVQYDLDVSSPLQGVAQSCLRRAAASCSLSRRRSLSPSMTVTSAWWVRRSRRLTMEVALGNTTFQFLNARLVVTMIERLS